MGRCLREVVFATRLYRCQNQNANSRSTLVQDLHAATSEHASRSETAQSPPKNENRRCWRYRTNHRAGTEYGEGDDEDSLHGKERVKLAIDQHGSIGSKKTVVAIRTYIFS